MDTGIFLLLGALLCSSVNGADPPATPAPNSTLPDPSVGVLDSAGAYKASGVVITNKTVLFAVQNFAAAEYKRIRFTDIFEDVEITVGPTDSKEIKVGSTTIGHLVTATFKDPITRIINTQLLGSVPPPNPVEKRINDTKTLAKPLKFEENQKNIANCYDAYVGKTDNPLLQDAFRSILCTNLVVNKGRKATQAGAPFIYASGSLIVVGLDSGFDVNQLAKAPFKNNETQSFPEALVISVPEHLTWILEKEPEANIEVYTTAKPDSTSTDGAAQQLASALMVFICAIFAKIML